MARLRIRANIFLVFIFVSPFHLTLLYIAKWARKNKKPFVRYDQFLVIRAHLCTCTKHRQVSWLGRHRLTAAFPNDSSGIMAEGSSLTVTRSHRSFTCFPFTFRFDPEAPGVYSIYSFSQTLPGQEFDRIIKYAYIL